MTELDTAKKKPVHRNIVMILVDEERVPMHFPAGVSLPAREWLGI